MKKFFLIDLRTFSILDLRAVSVTPKKINLFINYAEMSPTYVSSSYNFLSYIIFSISKQIHVLVNKLCRNALVLSLNLQFGLNSTKKFNNFFIKETWEIFKFHKAQIAFPCIHFPSFLIVVILSSQILKPSKFVYIRIQKIFFLTFLWCKDWSNSRVFPRSMLKGGLPDSQIFEHAQCSFKF